MIPYIIMIISLLFDGILTNFLPYMINDLSLFTPLLTLTSILLIYPFYKKKLKDYFITVFILGIVYDLFYTNLLFFNGVLFLLIGYFISKVEKLISLNSINVIVETLIIIIIYELITGLLLFTFNMVPITIPKIFYKILHSLILNLIYAEVVYFILKIIPKKYKKISIN